ncbi:DDB1- and CUL4-associated factor 8 isoform X2 [Rhopalosiphum maidis]|uniref:DDB1- and CUL4-associated factor 8 isoform X2 n=1 Tax=Rhopalosiphum maidis TaxID=43146 RepID=UPI000EFFA46A|nr:DDB1- and CUL4-associated factor 8 isoform X2 [Rhopalosiphum maidis]
MSDTDSDSSTDSDNNNSSPFFNHYLGYPRGYYGHDIESPGLETDDSSDSDVIPNLSHFDSTSSDSEALLNNTSDEFDCPDNDSSCSSRNSSTFKLFKQRHINKMKVIRSKSNYWCLPKELYNREIGHYNRRAQWGYKFYQSTVGVQKLKLSKQLKGHQGCVNSLDFNKTGEIIASGSDDFRICLWNWSNGKCLLSYSSLHTRNIFQTKFLTTHGGTHIVSSGRDGLVVLSAVNNYDFIYSKIIARHDSSCNKVGVHHDTPYVVLSCGDDGIVKNIDIRESPINENERITNILHIKNMHGTSMHLYGIDINPMNPYEFIVNGDDEYVRMYDKRKLTVDPVKLFHRELKNTKPEKTGDSAVIEIDDSAINGTDNSDVDGSDDGGVDEAINDVFDIADIGAIANGNVNSDYDEDEISSSASPSHYLSHITSAVYSYCGTEILASYSEDDIYLFDTYGRSNSVLHSYSGHLNRMTVKGVNFYGPRSDYVVSGSDCGFIFIWDKKTEAIVQRKHADKKGCANVLEAHPHIPTLATSGLDKTIKIWEPLNMSQQPNKKKLRMLF